MLRKFDQIYSIFRIYHVGGRPKDAKIRFSKAITRPARRRYGVLLKCVAGHGEEGKEEDISKATLIWRAVKLPMYTVALIPITVCLFDSLCGSILIFAQTFKNLDIV